MKLIYISGPYSIGDKVMNVLRAIEAGNQVLEIGAIPFIPHLCHFWDMMTPRPLEDWMKIDYEMLKRCDGLLWLEGKSIGAWDEVGYALRHQIPVYRSIEEVKNAL